MSYIIWSNTLLLDEPAKTCCYVNESKWNEIYDLNNSAKRIFAKITVGQQSVICAVGQPVINADIDITNSTLFVPVWAINKLKVDGVGEVANVEWCTEEYFPNATRILVRPQDYKFYESDVKEELEHALTQYGVLEVGTSIPIQIQALNGLEINFDVIHLEPATIVLMEGNEIAIEFEKSFNEPEAVKNTSMMDIDFDSPMIPLGLPPVDGGHVLGGTSVPRLPDGRRWNPWV